MNAIIPRELGFLSHGVAGLRIRSWRSVKVFRLGDGLGRARIVEETDDVGAPRTVRWKCEG